MFQLPFSTEQFLEVFRLYNEAVWPAQIIAYLIGIIALILIIRRTHYRDQAVASILGLFWLWNGLFYHIQFFSTINQGAYLFGGLFILQGLLFLYLGLWREQIHFTVRMNSYGVVGILLLAYALLIYPVLGITMGHAYPKAPMFGIAPCPMTIFTFGLLLWTKGRIPPVILIIPVLWSLIGFTAAFKLGIVEDTGLIVSGVVASLLLMYRNRKQLNHVLAEHPD